MRTTRRELSLQKRIVAAVTKMGGVARILHQNRYTKVGDADVYGCYRGRMFQFEVKDDRNEEPTKIQRLRQRQWEKAGALVRTIYSVKQAEETLRRHARWE